MKFYERNFKSEKKVSIKKTLTTLAFLCIFFVSVYPQNAQAEADAARRRQEEETLRRQQEIDLNQRRIALDNLQRNSRINRTEFKRPPLNKSFTLSKKEREARDKVKENMIEEAKQAALAIVADSRAEEGNINYDIHQALDDPAVFVWHETWANKAAIDEHFETQFFKDFYAQVEKFAAEPPQITLTKMITEKA